MILLITFLLTYGALWLQKRSGDHCAVEEGVHEDGLKKRDGFFIGVAESYRKDE